MSERLKGFCDEVKELYSQAWNTRYSNALSITIENQKRYYAEAQLILARWRMDLPEHYRPLIDFYQEEMDETALSIDRRTSLEKLKA